MAKLLHVFGIGIILVIIGWLIVFVVGGLWVMSPSVVIVLVMWFSASCPVSVITGKYLKSK